MATTIINIKTIEWSSNPVNTGQATLLKINVTRSVTDVVKCSTTAFCGKYNCGQQVTSESNLTP